MSAVTPTEANAYVHVDEDSQVEQLYTEINGRLNTEFNTGGRVSVYVGYPVRHVLARIKDAYTTAGWTIREDFQRDGYVLTFTEA